jgi:hypothetical protein
MKKTSEIPGKIVQILVKDNLFFALTDEGKVFKHITYFSLGKEKFGSPYSEEEWEAAERHVEWMDIDDMDAIKNYSKKAQKELEKKAKEQKAAKE